MFFNFLAGQRQCDTRGTLWWDRLVGQVVRHLLKSGRPGIEPHFPSKAFSKPSHACHGIPVVVLPGTGDYKISAEVGWPSVCILQLGGIAGLISSFSLCVQRKLVDKGIPMVVLPGTGDYRISAEMGWPSVCILHLGGLAGLISSFSLCVQRKLVDKGNFW